LRNETIGGRPKALAIMLAAGFGVAAASLGHAQNYPNRVIRIIAPYTPGSPNDVMARLLAQRLQASLGQPIIIDDETTPMIPMTYVVLKGPW
jgi:tripartite-type tricarboxylate transporter receptor subunit TctC